MLAQHLDPNGKERKMKKAKLVLVIEPKEAWVIISEELNGAIVPAWWDTDEKNFSTPVTYATQREAYLEIVDLMMHRIETFMSDETLDCLDRDEDMVVPCTITNGIITTEYGELFSPFKPQSDYGR